MSSLQAADGLMPSAGTDQAGLADEIRRQTADLHRLAERSGVIREILRGRVDRAAYVMLLRNLLLVYEQLEIGLRRHRASPLLEGLARSEIYRASALEHDLQVLAGPGWREAVPVLASGRHYAARVAASADGGGDLLIPHAYVRYLGDLNGGLVLKRLAARALAVGDDALSFYDFPAIADLIAFRASYRAAIDNAGRRAGQPANWVAEAAEAFRLNIALSEAVMEAGRS